MACCKKEAQKNTGPTTSTNWITESPEIREVNGQLYNNRRDHHWETIGGDIVAVLTDKIVVQTVTKTPAAYGANEYGQRIVTAFKKIPGLKFVVQNYREKDAAVGESIWVKAIRNGVTNYNGEVLELWDCGKPHKVMVITTNFPPQTTNNN